LKGKELRAAEHAEQTWNTWNKHRCGNSARDSESECDGTVCRRPNPIGNRSRRGDFGL